MPSDTRSTAQSVTDALTELQEFLYRPHPWWLRRCAPAFTLLARCTGYHWYYGRDRKLHIFKHKEKK